MNKYSITPARAGKPLSRPRRLALLTRLIREQRLGSHEELIRALRREGVSAAQATLSRDLRSLGVVRRPGPDGTVAYELPAPAPEMMDRQRQTLDLKAFVNEVLVAQNLVVIKTPPGHANAVGRAIDLLDFPAVIGTVAGDDTVLAVALDAAAARRFKRHLELLSRAARIA